MQSLAAAWTQMSIDPEAHDNWRGHANSELAKPQGLCIHTSANFEWDPPWLVVCHATLRFCRGFETWS